MLQIAQFVCNKEQTTNIIGIDQYNRLLPFHQTQVIKKKTQEYISLSEWERAEKINLTFQGLKKVPDSPITLVSGFANLPTDFLIDDGITYTQTVNSVDKERPVQVCSGSEFKYRQTTSLKAPSAENPIAQIIGNKIQVKPILSNPVLNFQYIRKPITPYLDWYVDYNQNIIYRTAGDTVNIVNGDVYNQISNLILTGVTLEYSDNYYLYWEIVWSYTDNKYKLKFYSDSSKTILVAIGVLSGTPSSSFTSSMTITAQLVNNVTSGISGTCTINILPYLTLGGNSLSEISSLTLNGITDTETYYWEILCTPYKTQGNNTGVTTSFNLYTDQAKLNKVYSTGANAISFSSAISFQGITGNVSIQNALTQTITGNSYANASIVITEFRVIVPTIYNQNNFYYSFDDSNIANQIFKVYSDSNRTQLIMSGTRSFESTSSLIILSQENGSGYSGWVKVATPYTWAITGDTYAQLSSIVINGITPANSTNGRLYFRIQNQGIGGYWVGIYKDSGYTNIVAYGSYPSTAGTITFGNYLGNGITGSLFLGYTHDQLTGISYAPNSGNYTHTGNVLYQSGDWSTDNTIKIQQNTLEGNSYLKLPDSLTVECELLDEDKIDILQGILKDIALNVSREDILKLASEL